MEPTVMHWVAVGQDTEVNDPVMLLPGGGATWVLQLFPPLLDFIMVGPSPTAKHSELVGQEMSKKIGAWLGMDNLWKLIPPFRVRAKVLPAPRIQQSEVLAHEMA
jgi:hypothetical protein